MVRSERDTEGDQIRERHFCRQGLNRPVAFPPEWLSTACIFPLDLATRQTAKFSAFKPLELIFKAAPDAPKVSRNSQICYEFNMRINFLFSSIILTLIKIRPLRCRIPIHYRTPSLASFIHFHAPQLLVTSELRGRNAKKRDAWMDLINRLGRPPSL